MRYTIFILSLLFPFLSIVAQPKHEVRAAWVTAVYGLDWPRTRATTPQTIRKQKEELIDILDKLKAANFNTILFQTRTRGDVLYPSAIEPFNSILTGKTGGNPGYDPLAFAVEECHKRGMECHAWMVCVPLFWLNYLLIMFGLQKPVDYLPTEFWYVTFCEMPYRLLLQFSFSNSAF